MSVASCTFVKQENFGFTVEAGIFSSKFRGSCVSYDGAAAGSAHRTGKAFGTLACLSASACLVLYPLVVLLLKDGIKKKKCWLVTKILYCVTLFCVFLTFSALGDLCFSGSADCKLGAAGVITVLNVLVLIPMIASAFIIPLPEEPLFEISACRGGNNVAPSQTTTTKTIETTEEGDKKIIEEALDENGNAMTTVTVEKKNEGV